MQFGNRPTIGTDCFGTITLPLSYSNTRYTILNCSYASTYWGDGGVRSSCIYQNTTKKISSFVLIQDTLSDSGGNWFTIGY